MEGRIFKNEFLKLAADVNGFFGGAMRFFDLKINLALLVCQVGPLFLFFWSGLGGNLLIILSIALVFAFSLISSALKMIELKRKNAYAQTVSESDAVAIDQLAKIELSRIFSFPSSYLWRIEPRKWELSKKKRGATISAVFYATKDFPYILFGFLILFGLTFLLVGDVGPGYGFLAKMFGKQNFIFQVSGILSASWISSNFLFLGINRLIYRFHQR